MYPYDIDPRSYINSALALQTPTGAGMPRMTPASHSYYGPTHQALADTLAAALARQASNAGLFAPPTTPGVSGGLMAPAGTTPSASFFRMPSDFSKPVYIPPVSTSAAPSTGVSNTAQGVSGGNGGNHTAPEQPTYSPDFTRSNGPVGTANGFTGPYSNGGGPGDSFVDGSLLGGIGNFFYALTNPASTPTSIDATGADTNTAATPSTYDSQTLNAVSPATEGYYRLSANDMMPSIGAQPSIIGTPLAPPSNDMMPGIGAQPSITGTDIGTPMQEPSQTLNGLLKGNYEPVTGYSNNFSPLTSANLTPAPNADSKIQDRIISAEDVQNNSAATRQQAEQAAAQEAANIKALQKADAAQAAAQDDTNSANAGSLLGNPSQTLNAVSPTTEGGDTGDSRGGPITKKKLFGNKPNNGDDGWGTLKQGEYVIRPESVKVLPPGLLSALNDIYKSPNPKKTLRGLLG